MVHGSDAHFLANLLTVGDKGDSNDGSNLMDEFFLVIFVLGTEMKELLDLNNVSRASVSAGLENKRDKVRHVLVRKHLEHLKLGLNQALLSQEQKSKTKSEDSGEAVLEIFLFLFEKDLSNALSGVLIARTTEDHSN